MANVKRSQKWKETNMHSLSYPFYLFAISNEKKIPTQTQKKKISIKLFFYWSNENHSNSFRTRYETKCFQRNLSPNLQMELPTENLSQLSLNSGITKSVSTMASSTSIKRVTGSQKVTTSFNSTERKN